MAEFVTPPFDELEACVTDPTRPAAARTRGIFYLRTIGTVEAAEVLHRGAWPSFCGVYCARCCLLCILCSIAQQVLQSAIST